MHLAEYDIMGGVGKEMTGEPRRKEAESVKPLRPGVIEG